MHQLRDYQLEAVQNVRLSIREGYRRILLVAPTGSGKTTVACDIIHGAVQRNNPCVFLAHRKELIDQCSARLDEHGVDHGIFKAGNKRVAPDLPVQVASVMTLVRRKIRPPAKIFFIDEAHRAMATSYLKVLEAYPDAVVIGLTATPFRLDGRGLGHIFQKIEECSSPAELTERGYLVPARVFSAPVLPSFGKIKKRMGDYDQGELASAVNRNSIIGNIYSHWIKYAPDRLTVCFAVSRLHAKSIQETFLKGGVPADYIDAEMSESEREDRLAEFSGGKTKIMCNVGILTEGWDVPTVSAVILARPTQSTALYLQMAGRSLRPAPGKEDTIILDHGGNTMVHGFVTEDRTYDLDGLQTRNKGEAIKRVRTCEKCFCLYSGTLCPECGHKNEIRRADVKEIDGELMEMDPAEALRKQKRYLHEMLRKQVFSNYKPGYAAARFRERYNRWPGKQLGVKPNFLWDPKTRKFSMNGFDYSKAMKEAGCDRASREKSSDRHLARIG
jgi:superfamily II DNA or RNA helicase